MRFHFRKWPFVALFAVCCVIEHLVGEVKSWAGKKLVEMPEEEESG